MNNEANRLLITLTAAAVIVLMAVVIFLTWSADADVIDRIGDLSEYLDEHNDSAGKLIVTLAALVLMVLSLLLIIVQLAPEDEERELRVKQAGAVTIVPAMALRRRLEETLVSHPEITTARARVSTGDKGIATTLNITVVPTANVAAVSREAVRIAVDTIQTDLGLPVQGVPTVRVTFGEAKTGVVPPSPPGPVASSMTQPPAPEPGVEPSPPAREPDPYAPVIDPAADEAGAGASPGPVVYEPPPAEDEPEPAEGAPGTDVSRDPWRQA